MASRRKGGKHGTRREVRIPFSEACHDGRATEDIRLAMRRILAAAALCALPILTAAPATAQRAGSYTVQGTGPDGSDPYSGTLELIATGPQTWRVVWRIAGESINGIGVSNGRTLSTGYRHGGEVGSALYEVQPNGVLEGIWTSGREGGLGRERLTPRGGAGK